MRKYKRNVTLINEYAAFDAFFMDVVFHSFGANVIDAFKLYEYIRLIRFELRSGWSNVRLHELGEVAFWGVSPRGADFGGFRAEAWWKVKVGVYNVSSAQIEICFELCVLRGSYKRGIWAFGVVMLVLILKEILSWMEPCNRVLSRCPCSEVMSPGSWRVLRGFPFQMTDFLKQLVSERYVQAIEFELDIEFPLKEGGEEEVWKVSNRESPYERHSRAICHGGSERTCFCSFPQNFNVNHTNHFPGGGGGVGANRFLSATSFPWYSLLEKIWKKKKSSQSCFEIRALLTDVENDPTCHGCRCRPNTSPNAAKNSEIDLVTILPLHWYAKVF